MQPTGLTFVQARLILLEAYRDALAVYTPIPSPSSMGFSTILEQICLLLGIILYTVIVCINCTVEFIPGMAFTVGSISLIVGLDHYTSSRYKYAEENEIIIELQNILASYERDIGFNDTLMFETEEGSSVLSGITHSSICTTYRNEKWHRLPTLLLCKGDAVALMAGDLAPGAVIEMVPETEEGVNMLSRRWRCGATLAAGDKVLLNQSSRPDGEVSSSERHRVISSDSAELLAISGDIRVFQMEETPLTAYLTSIFKDQEAGLCAKARLSILEQLYTIVVTEKRVVMCVLLSLFMIAAAVRLALVPETRELWAQSTVIPLLVLLVCFISWPKLYYILAEVLVTSDLLAILEVDLQLQNSSETNTTSSSPSPTTPNPIHAPNSTQDDDSEEQFDDDDIEERVEENAAEISSHLTAKRWIYYLIKVLRTRMGMPAYGDNLEIPIPFIKTHLLEVLGSITFVAFIDDDVVCEGYSIAEELFLLKSQDADVGGGNKGLVLDLHANAQATGSRFESPIWWKHLLSLKPIGLNALLTYAPSPLSPPDSSRVHSTMPRHYHHHHKLLPQQVGNLPKKSRSRVPLSKIETELISHVRRPIPLESLRELSEEIGFCDDDVAGFTRMLEVNMLVPRLTDRKLLEDTHAWGQDETRRRGTLVPELRGIIAHDKSNDSLQMMIHGSPTVLLNYCREYWDGASITSLDDRVKQVVLAVYDRWNLEDFDVVAMSYAPVPLEVHPLVKAAYEANVVRAAECDIDGGHMQHQQSTVLFFVDPSARYLTVAEKKRQLAKQSTNKVTLVPTSPQTQPERFLQAEFDFEASINAVPASPLLSPSPNPVIGYQTRKRSSSDPSSYKYPDQFNRADADSYGNAVIPAQELVYEATLSMRTTSVENLQALNLEGLSSKSLCEMVDSSFHLEDIPKAMTLVKSRSYDSSSPQLPADTELMSYHGPDLSRERAVSSASHMRSLSALPLGTSKRRRREPKSLYTSVFPVLKHQVAGTIDNTIFDSCFGDISYGKVFLGMAASSVPIRTGISQLREDLTDAGVRFIYFSPRNMRRSKPVASKIGIPFDWNCAISLRELRADENDPHRHISSYADWDVHAKMPHGVSAIRRHLDEVDNVPLLVSLYTDATPSSVRDIISVFREYGEVVLTIGSAYRVTSRDIFGVADLSVGVSLLPGVQTDIPSSETAAIQTLSAASSNALCRPDMLLVFRLIRFNSPSLLQIPVPLLRAQIENKDVVNINLNPGDAPLEFSSLLEAIRVGRIFLLNATQVLTVLSISLISLALIPVLTLAVPIALPAIIPPPLQILFLFVYIPLLALSLLSTHANPQDTVMSNTPRKRSLMRKPKDDTRLKTYVTLRCLCVAVSVFVTQWLAATSLYGDTLGTTHKLKIYPVDISDAEGLSRFWTVQDVTSGALLLALIGQSNTLLHRGQLFPQLPTIANSPAYCLVVTVLLIGHGLLLFIRCALRASGTAIYQKLHWSVWLVLALIPQLGAVIGFVVNSLDSWHYRRYLQFLRLEFDTKLGMHSPR